MSKTIVAAILSCLALPLLHHAATAGNVALAELVSLCENNVTCSNQATVDGTIFKLQLPHRTHTMLCQQDGSCETLLARGQKAKIEDMQARLNAK
jgi:hypothetical protein